MKHYNYTKADALWMVKQWMAQSQASTIAIEQWCQHCLVYRTASQQERDETGLYICTVCDNPVDENATPF